MWYFYGELHRDDGAAVIYPNGERYWYMHGKSIYPKITT